MVLIASQSPEPPSSTEDFPYRTSQPDHQLLPTPVIDPLIFLAAFGFVAIDGSRLDPNNLILIG